eukprot:gene10956-14714_t
MSDSNDGISISTQECEKLVLRSIEESVIATDLLGKIIYWNTGAEKLFGWSADEVLGKNVIDITPNDCSYEDGVQILNQLTKGSSWTGQFVCRKRDNSSFNALVTNRPIYRNGQLYGIVGTSVDMQSEFERHQFTTSLTAHELRAPITGIIGIIDALLEDDKVTREDLEIINLSCHTLLDFVNDLINKPVTHGKDDIKVVKCEIRKQFCGIIETLKPLGRHANISVVNDVSSEIPEILQFSLITFQQLLFNVLSNSIKYTKASSQIVCKLSNKPPEDNEKYGTPLKIIQNLQQKNFMFVSVKDQGQGIHPQEAKKLFQRYSKLTNKVDASNGLIMLCGSTGLGLYNCKELAQSLGGDIWLSWSEIDIGAEFTFAIPYVEVLSGITSLSELNITDSLSRNSLCGSIKSSNTSLASTVNEKLTDIESDSISLERPLRVLVADDDPICARILTRLLSNEQQFQVSCAVNGLEALNVVLNNIGTSNEIDLLISDINMPLMSGLELTKSIRDRLGEASLPYVCVTSATNTSPHILDECKAHGVSQFETKPLTKEKLKSILRQTRTFIAKIEKN